MIRTKTQIFIQRLSLEMHNLREYAGLLEHWNTGTRMMSKTRSC